MNTLEYTVSLLETMPFKPLSEEEIVKQLTESMKKSDMGATTSADVVSKRMREKYAIINSKEDKDGSITKIY